MRTWLYGERRRIATWFSRRCPRSNAGGAVEPLRVRALLRESLWYAVPSALYMIDNNLLYYILIYLDAATHVLVRRCEHPVPQPLTALNVSR